MRWFKKELEDWDMAGMALERDMRHNAVRDVESRLLQQVPAKSEGPGFPTDSTEIVSAADGEKPDEEDIFEIVLTGSNLVVQDLGENTAQYAQLSRLKKDTEKLLIGE